MVFFFGHRLEWLSTQGAIYPVLNRRKVHSSFSSNSLLVKDLKSPIGTITNPKIPSLAFKEYSE